MVLHGHARIRRVDRAVALVQALLGGVGAAARGGGAAALGAGPGDGLRRRLQLARRRFTRSTAGVAAAAAALILALGGFIFYNTNVLNEYSTPRTTTRAAREYERRYRQYERIPQPQRTASSCASRSTRSGERSRSAAPIGS